MILSICVNLFRTDGKLNFSHLNPLQIKQDLFATGFKTYRTDPISHQISREKVFRKEIMVVLGWGYGKQL